MLFRRLATFAGGFGLSAVEQVCGAADATVDVLAALVDKSLVQVEPRGPEARYHLLGPMREYAATKLREADEELAQRKLHRDWCAAFIRQTAAAWREHQAVDLLESIETELDNIRAALRLCVERDEAGAGLDLVDALWFYWNVRGHVGEWLHVVDVLIRLPSAADLPANRARALNAVGYLALAHGDDQRAKQSHEEALAIARELGDASATTMSLRRIGIVRRLNGDIDGALAALDESLALARRIGDTTATYLTLYVLADTLRGQGDVPRAIEVYRESLDLMRATGDPWHAAQVLLGLGYALAHVGDYDAADAALRESIDALQTLGDRRIIAACVEGFAFLASCTNRFERAAYLFGGAGALREAVQSAPDAFARNENARAMRLAEAALGAAHFNESVARGRQQSPASVIAFALEAAPVSEQPAGGGRPAGLTPRETEVARLLARGLSNRAIARELVISEQTAETHVKRILSKLGVGSRAEAAARAVEFGIGDATS